MPERTARGGERAEALNRAIYGAAARWPRVLFDRPLLEARWPEPAPASPEEWCLAQLACHRNAPAREVVDAMMRDTLEAWFGQRAFPGELRDEVHQTLRMKLYGVGEAPPVLAAYEGQGPLSVWLRVVGVRTALNVLRGAGAGLSVQPLEDGLERWESPLRAADQALVTDEQRRFFKLAFEAALSTLEPRERLILSLRFVQQVAVEGIADAFSVHRVTAARWIRDCRQKLAANLRRELRRVATAQGTSLDPEEGWVDSQLDLSLSRLLPTPHGS